MIKEAKKKGIISFLEFDDYIRYDENVMKLKSITYEDILANLTEKENKEEEFK